MDLYLIKLMREMEDKLKEVMGEREFHLYMSEMTKRLFKEELMNHPFEGFRKMAEDPDVFEKLTGNDYEFNDLMEIEREFRQIVDDEEEEE